MQAGETQLAALHREVSEETGITKIDHIHHITMFLSHYRCAINEHQQVGLIFSLFAGLVQSDVVTLSNDHAEYIWATHEQAAQLVSDLSTAEFLKQYIIDDK